MLIIQKIRAGGLVAIATLLIVLASPHSAEAVNDDAIYQEGCVDTYLGIEYMTLNYYDIAADGFAPGSNNFQSSVNQQYFDGVHQGGGLQTIDNRSGRDPNGCDGIDTTTGGYYISVASIFSTYGAGTFRLEVQAGPNGDWYYYEWQIVDGSTANVVLPITDPSSRIIEINSPSAGYNNSMATSTSLTFDYDYFSGDPFVTKAGIEIQNLSYGLQLDTSSVEEDIVVSGVDNYSQSFTVTTGNYQWRPYLRNASSTDRVNGQWRFFTIGGSDQQSIYTPPGATSTIGDLTLECEDGNFVTNSVCNVMGFLFVPSPTALAGFQQTNETLKTKFPFAYAYDFKDSVNTLYTTSQTASSAITMDFGGLGDLTLISAAQLSAVPYASWIRTMLGYLMWIMFAVSMYRRTLKIFDHSTSVS